MGGIKDLTMTRRVAWGLPRRPRAYVNQQRVNLYDHWAGFAQRRVNLMVCQSIQPKRRCLANQHDIIIIWNVM